MKSLIIYHSTYRGNTEKIAKIIAAKINADLIHLKESSKINIEDYDLIGLGSGVYKEAMSTKLFNFVEKLDLYGKDVFILSTSGVGMKFYNKKLVRFIELKGAKCVGSFACKGSFNSREFSDKRIFEFMSKFAKGHPNDKDCAKAETFIKKAIT